MGEGGHAGALLMPDRCVSNCDSALLRCFTLACSCSSLFQNIIQVEGGRAAALLMLVTVEIIKSCTKCDTLAAP